MVTGQEQRITKANTTFVSKIVVSKREKGLLTLFPPFLIEILKDPPEKSAKD